MAGEADKLIAEKTIAEFLGINPKVWAARVRYRGCPHYRVGRGVVYHADKLVAWMDANLERVHQVRTKQERDGA